MIPFLNPDIKIYTYRVSEKIAIEKIYKITTEKSGFWSEKDMSVSFINDSTFIMRMIRLGPRMPNNSVLVCTITALQNDEVSIETRILVDISAYVISCVGILLGLACLYNAIKDAEPGSIVGSLAMTIIIPFLAIGLSKASAAAVRQRYKMYIDKALKN